MGDTRSVPPPENAPSNDVLAERIAGLTTVVAGLSLRIDGMATEKTIVDLMASRDREFNTKIDALSRDLRDLVNALASERTERITADSANEERANRARTFALSALGLGLTFLFGLLGLILSLGQGGLGG